MTKLNLFKDENRVSISKETFQKIKKGFHPGVNKDTDVIAIAKKYGENEYKGYYYFMSKVAYAILLDLENVDNKLTEIESLDEGF